MKEVIKRAIEGGYDNAVAKEIYNDYLNLDTITINRYGGILLDPEFWKCLGKAEGWSEGYIEDDGAEILGDWFKNWVDLIVHLAGGEDINSFFDNLLK